VSLSVQPGPTIDSDEVKGEAPLDAADRVHVVGTGEDPGQSMVTWASTAVSLAGAGTKCASWSRGLPLPSTPWLEPATLMLRYENPLWLLLQPIVTSST
jgi:hypothetical protein